MTKVRPKETDMRPKLGRPKKTTHRDRDETQMRLLRGLKLKNETGLSKI
jgi:hypothetical protein